MLWKSNTFSCLRGRRRWSQSICLKFDLACGAWRQGSYWAARIGYCPLGLSTAAARAAGKHPREPGKDRLLPVCAAALSAQLSCSEIWRLLRRRLSDIKEKESGQLSCQQKKPQEDHYHCQQHGEHSHCSALADFVTTNPWKSILLISITTGWDLSSQKTR